MKNFLNILILISIFSCKENVITSQEKKSEVKTIKAIMDNEIQQIGNIYQPEKMVIKQNKIRTDNKKENYQITLINSNLLDNEKENVESHAEKIVKMYYENLVRNIVGLNSNKIIVEIQHRNEKKESFEYTEIEIQKLEK
ncbi:hypothetical protein [Flavobacterium sp.]|uniref:hypothetical protein n=1 Tax=Flavobacterium sp. TaxID=239 RepID=UPI003752F95F